MDETKAFNRVNHSKLFPCLLGSRILNYLLYANDLVLVSPSATGLQKLINCCMHYAQLLHIGLMKLKQKQCMYIVH